MQQLSDGLAELDETAGGPIGAQPHQLLAQRPDLREACEVEADLVQVLRVGVGHKGGGDHPEHARPKQARLHQDHPQGLGLGRAGREEQVGVRIGQQPRPMALQAAEEGLVISRVAALDLQQGQLGDLGEQIAPQALRAVVARRQAEQQTALTAACPGGRSSRRRMGPASRGPGPSRRAARGPS
jgi:hypothetical protein